MKFKKILPLLILTLTVFFTTKSYACHPLPLVNYNQVQYIPGIGLQVRAASDQPTCGCAEYWLDMEIRCDSSAMTGNGLTAGVWDSIHCFPFYQSAKMLKPNCVVQDYPWVTIPDSVLCPGMTYYYRLRENHNFNVNVWTPVMSFTMPGTLDTNMGNLVLTANPVQFCGSTQLGWFWNQGTGCNTTSCSSDTTYKWEVVSGEPMNVPVNFSCDTCPYPIASPSITTTYTLTITVGDSNSCGFNVYTVQPITVTPLPYPSKGSVTAIADCKGNVDLTVNGAFDTIQWQSSVNGNPYTNIAGADSSFLHQSTVTPGTCYRVISTTQCGSIASDTVCPTIKNGPTAAFSMTPPGQGLVNTLISFTDNSMGNIISWIWDFGTGDSSFVQNPSYVYQNHGIYNVTLIVTDSSGCSDTLTIEYPIISNIIKPNVITPNGDGQNDYLVFKNLEFYENYLKVFNRWGTIIFETKNYKNDWDGNNSSEGTYFFLLEIEKDGETETHKGSINILK